MIVTTIEPIGLEDTMKQDVKGSTTSADASSTGSANRVVRFWGVRYQVSDVARSIDFYERQLGFKLDAKHLPAFAQVSLDDFKLVLSGPGASGSRPMPDGRRQQPGGWNRVMLEVSDLEAMLEALKGSGLNLRNRMESGPGGKQVQLEDPDGNPIELFQPASRDGKR